ncbi:Additional periplasmic component NikK of nickel ECF transporter [Azospirillaceae bacterium]
MNPFLRTLIIILTFATTARSADAHFQLIYTPEPNLEKPSEIPLNLIFWHPFANGHVMDMQKPDAFFSLHKDKKTDLINALKPITFEGAANKATAFEAVISIKRPGDHIFALIPAPYFETSEDQFIQQITKSFVNVAGVPTDWSKPVGLPTEIIPLNKPTNILSGSTFTGRVLSSQKPASGVEIEIEFMAAEPDVKTRKAKPPTASPPPGGSIVVISDDNGVFTFGIPKPGFWGFAALGSGPQKTHDGKPLSQDAVLWIRAYDVK